MCIVRWSISEPGFSCRDFLILAHSKGIITFFAELLSCGIHLFTCKVVNGKILKQG